MVLAAFVLCSCLILSASKLLPWLLYQDAATNATEGVMASIDSPRKKTKVLWLYRGGLKGIVEALDPTPVGIGMAGGQAFGQAIDPWVKEKPSEKRGCIIGSRMKNE